MTTWEDLMIKNRKRAYFRMPYGAVVLPNNIHIQAPQNWIFKFGLGSHEAVVLHISWIVPEYGGIAVMLRKYQ